MNILHVVDMISQERAGGSAKVPFQLGEAQARLGHDVTIFTTDYQAKDQPPPKGVNLVKFQCVWNLLGVKLAPAMWWVDYSQFDILHLHNYRTYVNFIAASQNKPFVLQAHGSCLPMKSRTTKSLHNYLWRERILDKASAYIADAEAEIGQYTAEGADRENIYTIPVGIDTSEFGKAEYIPGKKVKTILFLGRFHHIKGADLLLRAFALIDRDNVTLRMVGVDYGVEAELKHLAVELGISDRVEFCGPKYDRDKAEEYAQADVYVMPSRYEMFGLTFLEALACGTPVIITDRCGAASLLPNECGQVVPFDEIVLADAINHSLDSREASAYRNYRRKWAKQYDWDKLAPLYIWLYEKILGK